MLKFPKQLFLASKSPRRASLLNQINIEYKVINIDFNEEYDPALSPVDICKYLSHKKALEAVSRTKEGIILTADTIVVINSKILGKPDNSSEAKEMLLNLSGKEHEVCTGFTLIDAVTLISVTAYETTTVRFRVLSNDEIDDYVDSGSPLDKAGAYGIQDDYGSVFVENINGCFYNVMGLPLSKFYSTSKEFIKKY